MNRRIFIIITFCFLLFVFLFAENHMELIWQQEGEFIESEYGFSLASLDFNGDGIDDLVVGSPEWNSSGIPGLYNQGKIYFYFGGIVFDSIPDLTIDGSQNQFHSRFGTHLENVHDINGDSYEDLAIIHYDHWESDTLAFIDVYYGGPDYDIVPDFTHIILRENVYLGQLGSLYELGDVNGDGFHDIGFYFVASETEINQYYIIYGGEFPHVEYWNSVGSTYGTIRGIGNINNDAFDDFLLAFKDPETELKNTIIIYGNTLIDTTLIDTLFSQTIYTSGGAYAGDFNGDETDDFIGCWSGFGGTSLWFGGEEHNTEPSVLFGAYGEGNKCFGYGDLNNDGIDDIVLGNPLWSNHQGKASFFIGDVHANGSIDLDIPAPIIVGSKFGTSIAVGDFNDDGFADAAVGAPSPYSSWYPGYVYVYAGNDSLVETTPVEIHEEEIPTTGNIEFNAYPNPFNPTVTFEIKFSNEHNQKLQIEVFNIKGQKVKTLPVSPSQSPTVSIVWNAEQQASVVYYCKLINVETKKQFTVQKITLLK
jgi:hypothetical protein